MASPNETTPDVTVGVIGAGRIGKLHIENLAHAVPGVTIKTIADIQIEGLAAWAAGLGLPDVTITTDHRTILDDPAVDAVVICSSTDTHARFIVEAAEAGKDVFCEKPIDYDLQRIRETLAAVEAAGVKLMIGFNRRFDHNFRRVRELVAGGKVGAPHVVKITSRDPAPPPIEYVKVSGGLFFDMTIHDWDMARYLAGEEVVEVYARGEVLIDPAIGEAGDVDTAVAVLQFASGAMGIIDNSRQAVYGYDQRVEVFGAKGAALAENDRPTTARLYTADTTSEDKIHWFFLERYKESYVAEMQAFFACLREDAPPPVTGHDGLQAVLIAMAAQRSLEEGRPVKVSEVA